VNVAAVSQRSWLLPGQMVVGLGLAETTPGRSLWCSSSSGSSVRISTPATSPMTAGVLGAVVATWATFAPASCGSS
jgi:chromate transporter